MLRPLANTSWPRGVIVLTVLAVMVRVAPVVADRSAAQGPSGLEMEKAGRFADAAVYYQRTGRGLREVWGRFWYGGDFSKAHPELQKALSEFDRRYRDCVARAELDKAALARIDEINALWMDEYVDEELGGYKLAFAWRAEEAEKHGDFLLAAELRAAAAEYCTLVTIPYHRKRATSLEEAKQPGSAGLHRAVVEQSRLQAERHQRMSRGDRLLAAVAGLQSPAARPQLRRHYFNSYQLYHQRVLAAKGGRWLTGKTPEQVAAILTAKGLTHADEDARFAAVVVLADLGERRALLTAFKDKSPAVRREAADRLMETTWAEGWAACNHSSDKAVNDSAQKLLKPLAGAPFDRTMEIVELLRGLDSPMKQTRTFCAKALQQISGKGPMPADGWRAWWKELGDLRPGLARSGPKGVESADATVDVGTWWQSGDRSVRNASNPLTVHPLPTHFEWRGKLVVTQAGSYRFFVRNRGEKLDPFGQYKILYFPSPCAKLTIDGKTLVPDPDVPPVEDAKMHVRIDRSKPIDLTPGLHDVRLELDVRSAGSWSWEDPSVRLYWESEHFLRRIVPADRLVHVAER